MQWRRWLALAEESQTEDEVARGWRYRQPLLVGALSFISLCISKAGTRLSGYKVIFLS
jgi:hypothetical protein